MAKEDLLKAGFFPEDSRPLIKDETEESSIAIEESDDSTTSSRSTSDLVQVSFKTQVIMLLQRERRNILRNKKALAARFVFTTVMSFLLGVIFWKIGDRSLASFPVSTHHRNYSHFLSQWKDVRPSQLTCILSTELTITFWWYCNGSHAFDVWYSTTISSSIS